MEFCLELGGERVGKAAEVVGNFHLSACPNLSQPPLTSGFIPKLWVCMLVYARRSTKVPVTAFGSAAQGAACAVACG